MYKMTVAIPRITSDDVVEIVNAFPAMASVAIPVVESLQDARLRAVDVTNEKLMSQECVSGVDSEIFDHETKSFVFVLRIFD